MAKRWPRRCGWTTLTDCSTRNLCAHAAIRSTFRKTPAHCGVMNALRFSRFVIVFAALLFAGSPLAAPLPAFTARYQLLQNGELIGEATMTLAPSGDDEWTFTTQSRGTSGMAALLGANVRETSRF
ncbi:MAG: DUF3108 domain-containing protein, partial [Pseudomonadota bacterium]|nr:DUF3108 domain-containing protein [Pseudomonadota bacterium]